MKTWILPFILFRCLHPSNQMSHFVLFLIRLSLFCGNYQPYQPYQTDIEAYIIKIHLSSESRLTKCMDMAQNQSTMYDV